MNFVNWIIDQFASEDIIDLYFVLSDLADIPINEAERCESAYYDSLASATAEEHKGEKIDGRTVW